MINGNYNHHDILMKDINSSEYLAKKAIINFVNISLLFLYLFVIR